MKIYDPNPAPPHKAAPVGNKTQQAIALVDAGMNPHAAAKQVGMAPNNLYRALKLRRINQGDCCPTCGRPLP